MDEILNITFLEIPVSTWFLAVGISAGGVVLALLVRWIAASVVRRSNARDNTESQKTGGGSGPVQPRFSFALRLIQNFIFPAIIIAGFYSASTIFSLKGDAGKIISGMFVVLFSLVTIRFFVTIVNEIFHRAAESDKIKGLTRYRPLRSISVIAVWVVGALFLLANLGFDITTVVAGLGIGGIAVALAGQAVLGDLFGYFVIIFDKPFELGDFLIFDDILGSVEKIGIKTTRIRSLGGEQIIVSNSDLTDSRVHNYKRMARRRVVFKIGVVYGTRADDVREIPMIIQNIIGKENLATFDRAHFTSYGDWSLVYEIVYYIESPDYNVYMDIQQRVNLAIYDEFSERKIQFAFPTQTVILPRPQDSLTVENDKKS